MSIKLLHSADWHIECKNQLPGKNNNAIKESTTIACLEYMIAKAEQIKPSAILISGDIFEKSKVWVERGFKEVGIAFDLITQLGNIAPVVAIKGTPNHDGAEQFEQLKELLKHNDQVKIMTEPELYHLDTKDGRVNIIGIPSANHGIFRTNHPGLSKIEENQAMTIHIMQTIKKLRDQCQAGQPIVLMTHYTVSECNTESGQVMIFAENDIVLPRTELNNLDFNLIALGHIHRPQNLPNSNIFYAGGINAFNFGDEGQHRGFYLHNITDSINDFYITPYQEYLTLHFDDSQIESFNNGDYTAIPDQLDNKVLRIYYQATQENINQFSATDLEKVLIEQSAVAWVSEITCEKCLSNHKQSIMSTDPIVNLSEYFNDDPNKDDLIAMAHPIIDTQTIQNTKSRGKMIPISMTVKNYRSYENESFDFSDIDFATVTGPNGTGKSSFFMDSIIDCLFEETRENDLTGWISNNPKAKSGSITFVFSIGDTICRVVRNRAKSGKCTLSLCEYIDDEWVDISGEKLKETQALIIDLVGDSLTIKSCGLILQDQYGIFLDVDKTERMRVLAGILGLNIYEQAKTIFAEQITDTRRELNQQTALKDEKVVAIKNSKWIANELTLCKQSIIEKEAIQIELDKELQNLTNIEMIQKQIVDLNVIKSDLGRNLYETDGVINRLNTEIEALNMQLAQEPEIREKAAQARDLELKLNAFTLIEQQHAEQLLNYDKIVQQKLSVEAEITELTRQLSATRTILSQKDALSQQDLSYQTATNELIELRKKGEQYAILQKEEQSLKEAYLLKEQAFNHEMATKTAEYERAQQSHALVESSGCKGSVPCPFIDQAKQAGDKLTELFSAVELCKVTYNKDLTDLNLLRDQKLSEIVALGYDPNRITNLEQTIKQTETAHQTLQQLSLQHEKETDLTNRIDKEQDKWRLSNQEMNASANRINALKNQLNDRIALQTQFNQIKHFIEREAALDGNKQVLALKISNLTDATTTRNKYLTQLEQNGLAISQLSLQLSALPIARTRMEIQTAQEALKNELKSLNQAEARLTLQKDARRDDIEAAKSMQLKIKELARQLALLEQLKEACSYTGIPHLIIKDEIKIIENKANMILSQMSGGNMTVSFETEKLLKSNKDKEVPILDIIINDQITGSLAYKSRSGGERVKVALASALALAELKASKTGVQLGFLFIDEPPFLDESGTEAYCDALEAINQRYAGMKVIAITHDVSMQSRFAQSIEITKTEHGSQIVR